MPVAMMAKEAVNRAFESSLAEGIRFERRMFYAAFALEDQKEGMAAFVEKRQPSFKTGDDSGAGTGAVPQRLTELHPLTIRRALIFL